MKFHHLALLVAVFHVAGNVANTTTCSNNGDLAENTEEDRNLAEKLDGHVPPDNSDPFYYTAGEVASGGLAAAIGYSGRLYTTESIIRHLPALDGYMQTCNTYRHLMVREQVFTMIGEVKHGLWQVQESGFIREYLLEGWCDGSTQCDDTSQRVVGLADDELLIVSARSRGTRELGWVRVSLGSHQPGRNAPVHGPAH
jgi:hypothetical protein